MAGEDRHQHLVHGGRREEQREERLRIGRAALAILVRAGAGTWQRLAPPLDPAPQEQPTTGPRPRGQGRRRPPNSASADDQCAEAATCLTATAPGEI
ncbi:hypothetical protein JCM4814A_92350 [Streptomyces phaeofaciens JCM 4814]